MFNPLYPQHACAAIDCLVILEELMKNSDFVTFILLQDKSHSYGKNHCLAVLGKVNFYLEIPRTPS